MADEEKKIRRKKVKTAVIVFLCVFLIAAPLFVYFRITTEARIAYREAKNVKLAFDMLEIEYYGRGSSVFDASALNGMSAGVQARLDEILEHDCDVSILSYSRKDRAVTAFIYSSDHYRVLYRYDAEKGDTWDVDYLIRILEYDGE